MSLKKLPEELIYHICRLFCQHCQERRLITPSSKTWEYNTEMHEDRRNLLNLSRTCRKWRHSAQECLHHHFVFPETISDDELCVRQVLFCRTIFERRGLAEQLRVAHLKHTETVTESVLIINYLLEPLKKYSKFFKGKSCLIKFRRRWEDYVVMLILLQTPNLQHLAAHGRIAWNFCSEYDIKAIVEDQALPRGLKSLSLGYETQACADQEDGFFIWVSENNIGGLLKAFERLQLLSILYPHLRYLPEKLPFQYLRSLRIAGGYSTKDDLETLVKSTGFLEEFVYRQMVVPPDPIDMVTAGEIFEMLVPMRKSLKRLVVDTSFVSDISTAAMQLENLEEMRIRADNVCDAREFPNTGEILDEDALIGIFPPYLKTLCVEITMEQVFHVAGALANYAKSTSGMGSREKKPGQVIIYVTDRFCMETFDDTDDGTMEIIDGWFVWKGLSFTSGPLQWYSCSEFGTNTMLW